ncbi:MAG: LLM class F420-dependent oxidoreductase [Acidimicrobiaceae bacterium]|nr:LLM class F420-dependent oxidoreductase [Acidimicrobiaceae bacterium]MBO0747116.1 LLM class F420-dependent oxidoreductase [Acidimicrobiaceae bacterium]
MQIGVVFPQTELGGDPGVARAYAAGVEEFGYRHILAYDHVLGADPAVHTGWGRGYTVHTTFHEPFVFFGYLAAITDLELVTGVIILPQRQTALVAKQVAELDLLSGGKFRFGVGLGWNAVEYEALDKEFTNRGRRIEEQVALLRRLWSEESVTFAGRWERVTGAGVNPLPIRRPIPIWFGGSSPAAWRRIGRLADGWFPQSMPGRGLEEALEIVNGAAKEAGRDPATVPFEGRVRWEPEGGTADLIDVVGRWEAAGASHLAVNTMDSGLTTVDDHLSVLAEVAKGLGLDRS